MVDHAKQTVIRMAELHRKLGQVIRKVAGSDAHFVVEKGGVPVVALLSLPEYERLIGQAARGERLRRFREHVRAIGEEAERQGLTEAQLMEELQQDRRAVYQEIYGNADEKRADSAGQESEA